MSNGSSDVRLASCRISCGTGSLQLSPRPLELSLKYCGVVTCSGMARCDTLQTRHFGKCFSTALSFLHSFKAAYVIFDASGRAWWREPREAPVAPL